MLDGWATTGHGTLPRRLAHALRHVVNAGVLPPGWRLPPERQPRRGAVGQPGDRHPRARRASRRGTADLDAGERDVRRPDRRRRRRSGPASPSTCSPVPASISPPGTRRTSPTCPPVAVDMTLLNAAGGGPGVNAFGLPAMRQAVADLYTTGGLSASPRATRRQTRSTSRPAPTRPSPCSSPASPAVARRSPSPTSTTRASSTSSTVSKPGRRPVRTDRAGMLPESLEEVITGSGRPRCTCRPGRRTRPGR